MQYRPEIDGLRALAVIPVLLFHAKFDFFKGGFIGVDIFFVISGYLITSIIYNEIKNNTFSIVNFYERRIRRIFQALFFVCFASIPFAWFWLLPSDFQDFSQSLVAVSLFSYNFLFSLFSFVLFCIFLSLRTYMYMYYIVIPTFVLHVLRCINDVYLLDPL